MTHLSFIDRNRKNPIMIDSMLSIVLFCLQAANYQWGQSSIPSDQITIRKTATSVPGVPSPSHEEMYGKLKH